jgi:hypothetical protein
MFVCIPQRVRVVPERPLGRLLPFCAMPARKKTPARSDRPGFKVDRLEQKSSDFIPAVY